MAGATVPPAPTSNFLRKAPSPFDKTSADIVLRSADLVDFMVHSHILVIASSLFETMLSLPQTPSQEAHTVDGRPVISVSENSETLEALLLMCYPVEKREVTRTVSEVELCWKAAMKYDMSLPVAILTKELHAAASDTPLRVWAAASRIGLESVARHAAELTLGWEINFTEVEILEGVSAGDYFRLRQFHKFKGDVDDNFRLLTPTLDATSSPEAVPDPSIFDPHKVLPDMPYPDLICRSSDGAEFRVHRAFLSVASPILYARIKHVADNHTQSGDPVTSLPVLRLEENSHILANLLRMCYPTITGISLRPENYAALLTAAEKYDMTRIRDDIQKHWKQTAEEDPLESYLTAARMGWTEGANIAARFALKARSFAEVYHPSMERSQALPYHSLVSFHDSFKGLLRTQEPYRPRGILKNRVNGRSAQLSSRLFSELTTRLDLDLLLSPATLVVAEVIDASMLAIRRKSSWGGDGCSCARNISYMTSALKKMTAQMIESLEGAVRI